MVISDPEEMTKIIVDSVIKAGVRAIISKGWSDKLSSSEKDGPVAVVKKNQQDKEKVYPSNIYMLKSVPHDWLFPRLAGAVHHGGAGTTAAGLRAGIPTVIKPYFGDQYFWAQRVEVVGVGVWCHDLTVKKLSAALTAITTDERMIKKAQLMGECIRAEDGVGTAVHYFYHDLPIARERLKSLLESRSNPSVSFRNNDEEDRATGLSTERTSSNIDDGVPLQHSLLIQPDGHPSSKGPSPKQSALCNHAKPSATEPCPDHSLSRIDDSDKTAESLATELEAIRLRRSDHIIHITHDNHRANQHADHNAPHINADEAKKGNKNDKNPIETSDKTEKDDKANKDDKIKDDCEHSDLSSSERDTKVITIGDNEQPSKAHKALGTIKSKMSRVKAHLHPPNTG
jgi:hypothetical protein